MITCEACKRFRQHYVKIGRSYRKVNCGHCVYPRLKHRVAGHAACVHFEELAQVREIGDCPIKG